MSRATSFSGGVELTVDALGQLLVGVLELLDAFDLEDLDELVVVDPELLQVVDDLAGLVVGAGATSSTTYIVSS
jgi:hypothetical protein